jgi:hypothetical protein
MNEFARDNQAQEQQTAQQLPECPYCGQQPCQVGLRVIGFGMETMAAIFFCGGCEKILSVAPLPRIEVPERKVLIPS